MHIHILGICGTFMGGLAALAKEAGHRVTGCDTGIYPPMSDQLRALGIDLIEGYDASQLALKPDVFVVGNVVSRSKLENGSPRYPLMEAILNEGCRYTSGPQWLLENVLHNRHVLAVAGTHGKTTTTSMLAWILEACGKNPGFLVGGVPLNFGISARLGAQNTKEQSYFVIEADEYDTAFFDKRSKFVHYHPCTVILNNLEFDHADIFDNLADIERQFSHLLRTVPAKGRIVANGLEESIVRVLNHGCWSDVRTFGAADSDFYAIGPAGDFEIFERGNSCGKVVWDLSGAHNVNNALAAIAAAQNVGITPHEATRALSGFINVKRRMEKKACIAKGVEEPITIWDDFAHHPSAIRTTVDGLRQQVGNKKRILAIFEPRSNTMKLGVMKSQLPWSLENADLAFCHSAGLDWNASEALSTMGPRAEVFNDVHQLVERIAQVAQSDDQLLCMSNGSFSGIHEKLAKRLAELAD